MGGERGPSPIVPLLMVGALGLFICWPIIMSFLETSIVLYFGGSDDDDSGSSSLLVLCLALLLMLLIYLLSSLVPTLSSFSSPVAQHEPNGFGSEIDGFGFGTFLMIMLFIVAYNLT